MKKGLLLGLAGLLLAWGCSDPPSWTAVNTADPTFSVEELGEPQTVAAVAKPGGNILNSALVNVTEQRYVSKAYQRGGRLEFEVRTLEFHIKTGGNWWKMDYDAVEKNLWQQTEDKMRDLQATKVSERQADLAEKAVKEIEFAGAGRTHQVRMRGAGDRFYVLSVSYPTSGDYQGERDHFFNSFKLQGS